MIDPKKTKTDSATIYKENFNIAKKEFKKKPSKTTSDKLNKSGTDLIQYNKRNTPIKKHGGSTKKKK